jgi:hypothetical protein
VERTSGMSRLIIRPATALGQVQTLMSIHNKKTTQNHVLIININF